MDVLLILDNVVENCISADSVERAQQFYPGHTCIERTGSAGPGWAWDGENFTAPVDTAPKAPLARLDFLRRIPAEARIQIRARAKVDPVIEDAMSMLDMANEIHLDDPDTVRLVAYLKMIDLLTEEQATAVLR